MDEYTDDDLRELLKSYGQDVGPINNSTRPYWQKALSKLTLSNVVSPKCASEKNTKKHTPLGRINQRNAKRRSRSVGSPIYSDQSVSENDFSDWEFGPILTDSPGSTPFPARVRRNQKSSSKQISSSGAVDRPESFSRDINSSKHISMTPNSTKTSEEISTRIQQIDRELREKLKGFGVHVQRGPMNATTRNIWRKRLDKLMSGSSPVECNSDSEIICPVSYGNRMQIKRRYGTSDIQNITNEAKFEDLDCSKNEYKGCRQNIRTSEGHLYYCGKLFFKIFVKVIFFIIVLVVVVLLVSPLEDGEVLEAVEAVKGRNISLQ